MSTDPAPTKGAGPAKAASSSARHLRLVSEFQPDATEIEERRYPLIASMTIYVLLALIASAIVWASLSQIDKIVVSTGKLVTTKPNIVVQPIETSVVRSIEVADGELVRAGQVLARLDSTFSQSDLGQLQSKVEGLDARIRRIEAELAGDPFEVQPSASLTELLEMKLHLQRKSAFELQMRNLGEALAKAEAALETTHDEIAVIEKRLETIHAIESMRTKLSDMQVGSRLLALQSVNDRLLIEANLARMKGSIIELKHAVEKARAEQSAYAADFRRQALEELIRSREERNAASEQIKKALLRKDMVELVSPVDAVVLEMANRSIGSVLKEAEPLLTLVPMDVPLEAEVTIDARDIGRVKVGQDVRVKFDTFPFQHHGTAAGLVRIVSRDAFPSESRPQSTNAGQPHYRARIEFKDISLRHLPDGFRPMPGMTVSGEIKVGERTIISYFLYPILRSLSESIREP